MSAGAAKGIGLACATCLGQEGAKVVLADVDDSAAKRYWIAEVVQHAMHM